MWTIVCYDSAFVYKVIELLEAIVAHFYRKLFIILTVKGSGKEGNSAFPVFCIY